MVMHGGWLVVVAMLDLKRGEEPQRAVREHLVDARDDGRVCGDAPGLATEHELLHQPRVHEVARLGVA